jgi:hypothetical protein
LVVKRQDPTYMRLRYLRCPAPELCVAGYFGNNVVDENVALAWALSLGGALTLLLAPLLALVRRMSVFISEAYDSVNRSVDKTCRYSCLRLCMFLLNCWPWFSKRLVDIYIPNVAPRFLFPSNCCK